MSLWDSGSVSSLRKEPHFLPSVPPHTAPSTEMVLRSCLPIDQWHLMSICDISPTGSLQKEQKLLWFDPSHCQSLPNPTVWVCESQADDPILPWGDTSALLLPTKSHAGQNTWPWPANCPGGHWECLNPTVGYTFLKSLTQSYLGYHLRSTLRR